ncbi:SPFH domain-containing protein [Streptomyces sp. NBC_01511]|uniref:SPFH domain-containing protein n=1 Tax=Streptomyces sp. NBC_01511 TaxID=2903889 RepID=UPI003867F1F2
MTTQTSQPNGSGDGQMLRGAPALRAAARNALTARGPAESEAPAEPPEAGPDGWNEAGWDQNVRLLAGPPTEPAPPPETEPETETETEPETGFEPEACYGGPVPEVADVVEWASEPELVSVELPAETAVSLLKSGAEPELEPVPVVAGSVGDATEPVRTGAEAAWFEPGVESRTRTALAAYADPQTCPEREPESVREAADVPHSRGESWALPTEGGETGADEAGGTEPAGGAVGTAATDDDQVAPEAEPVEPVDDDLRIRDEGVGDGGLPAPATGPAGPVIRDEGVGDDASSVPGTAPVVPSGIPAPVGDVSVRAGSGAAVPTRADLTFDSHRWSPLIVGEATHEIPVHLLFRDDDTHGAAQGAAPGPVAGRPRVRRAPAVPTPVAPPMLAPTAASRPATPVDTKLVERPGPTLPGWTAALVGVVGLLSCVAVLWWVGAVPETLTDMFGLASKPYYGIGIGMWALLTVAVTLTLFAFGGLGRGRVGHAWVLTLFGEYRGSVRRTGLLWVSPLLLRRRVDVRLRHWRSEPMPAVDANGTALRVVVLVVWRVRDTVRAALGVRDHEEYLREQVEAAMARVLSQLPADAFHEAAPTLRNAEVVGEALTRMLSAECRPVGLDVFSAQPTRIEYAPEISAAMQRSRIAAIDARHRDTVLTSVVDAVDDTVHRLTSRGLVELDDYERKVLVKDLTVAFYTGRHGLNEGN